jgi:molybdopterin converting factor small subunit
MSFVVELPGALEPFARGQATLRYDDACETVRGALDRLGADYAGVRDRVIDERGDIRAHVNVFVDGENIRFLQGLDTPLATRSTLIILPSVSGG